MSADTTTASHTLADLIEETEGVDDNPFALFGTDQDAEVKGVNLDYGKFYINIARAGGANKAFARFVSERTKPYKRLIAEDRLPENIAEELALDAVVGTVVKGWGSDKHGHGKMIGKDGEAIEYSPANVKQLFKDLPELFQDVYEQSFSTLLSKDRPSAAS